MDEVDYYDEKRTKEQVALDKKLLFEQFPDYAQTIVNGEITVVKEAGNYLATFINSVTYNGVTANYPSFLAVSFKNGEFRILREGVTPDAVNLDAPIFPKNRMNNAQLIKSPRLYGDFNGDELSDYAFVESPVISSNTATANQNTETVFCEGVCTSIIRFSNSTLKSINVENAYKSQLENLRDLNGDGADEIGFWSFKDNSKSLYIYDVANSKLITPPLVINTAIHKKIKLIDVIKKTGPSKITVTESVNVDGKWKLVSRVVGVE
ncbi:hypothetical protein ULMS_00440 [Patiriisocius marinistellae]|uniref:Uncharacterized protein n=2 Tax=Patiriisocius marinistellae TaxID=2494560 RepID=A0A5J4FWR6_9FLAO|nr:hypothetical protein ULMS_00440 [Patiriisocius marinistellae]